MTTIYLHSNWLGLLGRCAASPAGQQEVPCASAAATVTQAHSAGQAVCQACSRLAGSISKFCSLRRGRLLPQAVVVGLLCQLVQFCLLRSRVSGSHWGLIRKYGLNINRQSFRELAKDIGFVKVHLTCHALSSCYRCQRTGACGASAGTAAFMVAGVWSPAVDLVLLCGCE